MRSSNKCGYAALVFYIATIVFFFQDKPIQSIVAAVIGSTLLAASWVCEAIERKR